MLHISSIDLDYKSYHILLKNISYLCRRQCYSMIFSPFGSPEKGYTILLDEIMDYDCLS